MEERKARLAALAAKAGRSKPLVGGGGGTAVVVAAAVADAADATSSHPERAVDTTTSTARNLPIQNNDAADPQARFREDQHGEGTSQSQVVTKRPRRSDDNDNDHHQHPQRRHTEKDAIAKKEEEEKSPLELALEAAKAEISLPRNEQDLLIMAAPKKINWDLKRNIQPKLDKLEKRTQRAIVELLRQRLEHEASATSAAAQSDDELD